jgi:hypothetical protein
MKITVIPTVRVAGQECYTFQTNKLREAWKKLTETSMASKQKLELLELFGVQVVYDNQPEAVNAEQPHA